MELPVIQRISTALRTQRVAREFGIDALSRVLGIDALVLGSDRPYGEPIREFLGNASTNALRVTNPTRLITPSPVERIEWAVAS